MRAATNNPMEASDRPRVSVVVAAVWPAPGLKACLSALGPQRRQAEDVSVAASFPLPPALFRAFPWVSWAVADRQALVPYLWALGIRRAQGEIVALTTADFLPDEAWIGSIREAYKRLDAAGIGGRIDPAPDGPAEAWAAYFLRYSAYLRYREEQPVGDLAADNAAYPRRDLLEYLGRDAGGFWEPGYHRKMLAHGRELVFCPQIAVRACASFRSAQFIVQRHRHGRQYGRSRSARAGVGRRLLLLGACPLVPCILAWRTAARVWRDGRFRRPLLRCLPALTCFILAWTSGEVRGYLEGLLARRCSSRTEPEPEAG